MLRGTSEGLEFVFGRGSFEETAAALRRRLQERPGFYRGSTATAVVDGDPPDRAALGAFLDTVRSCGIELRGLYGDGALERLAAACAVPYLGLPRRSGAAVSDIARRRAARGATAVPLTDAARSLHADFAGARADLAARRAPRSVRVTAVAAQRPAVSIVDAVSTRYYRGTVRGGQSIQQIWNIVVVGDVNPGAEVVASGDIVIFGALRGTAHAGAEGDRAARVAALELIPTQLRIATFIAKGDGAPRHEPEEARVEGDRIVIAPLSAVAR
jgi:septum site-determining protein MinC